MTTTDARKRLDESIDRLERYTTPTHAINPDTGEFTRLDQESDMTDQPEPYDFHDEAHRALLNDNLSKGRQASLHALLAIHDTLTEIRDRLPERETEPEGITCMTCGASLKAGDPLDCRLHADDITEEPPVGYQVTDVDGDVWERLPDRYWRRLGIERATGDCNWPALVQSFAPLRLTTEADRERVGLPAIEGVDEPLEWLEEPVPVPHPDEALAKVLHDADSNGHFSWEGTGLMARADYLRMARAAREHIEANQLYAYRTVATERDKAEAELARVTKERDEAWRFRDAALEARDKAHDRYAALREDVEEFLSDHRDWTVMRGLADALARDDARAEGRS